MDWFWKSVGFLVMHSTSVRSMKTLVRRIFGDTVY